MSWWTNEAQSRSWNSDGLKSAKMGCEYTILTKPNRTGMQMRELTTPTETSAKTSLIEGRNGLLMQFFDCDEHVDGFWSWELDKVREVEEEEVERSGWDSPSDCDMLVHG